jgi:hypothetical protein
MSTWQGPILIERDFHLSMFMSNKSNGRIIEKYVDCFNDWVNKWGLLDINPCNRKFTWANNQNNLILAKLDRVFISTEWEVAFPLVRALGLAKSTSDHTPLLVDSSENCVLGQKNLGWLEGEDFKDVARKA